MKTEIINKLNTSILRSIRSVVFNHPYAYNAQVFRKHVLRESPTEMGGAPTLGGLGVLESSDEEDFEFELVGNAYALDAVAFGSMAYKANDRQDGLFEEDGGQTTLIIVPEEDDPEFMIKTQDLVHILLELPIEAQEPIYARIAYRVVSVEPTSRLHQTQMRYVLIRDGDYDDTF